MFSNYFMTYFVKALLIAGLLMGAVQGINTNIRGRSDKKPSSLFEAYAMYPQPYGYYMQSPYPVFGQQQQPPMFPPQQPQQPPPMYPMYPPYFMPPLPPNYYPQPPQALAFPQPYMQAQPSRPELPAAPPSRPVQAQAFELAPPKPAVELVEKAPVPAPALEEELIAPTKNPLKEALSSALDEASKQIDKANHNAALKLASFDDIDFSPRREQQKPISLAQEPVPIDNRILNWRELVGLPPANPVMENRRPISNDGVTPMLDGAV